MALTRDQIDDLAEDGVFLGNVYEIAQAIEAEVRKRDEEDAAAQAIAATYPENAQASSAVQPVGETRRMSRRDRREPVPDFDDTPETEVKK